MPVAGVGDDHLGRSRADAHELSLGHVDHRLEMAEAGRVDGHLGGDNDRLKHDDQGNLRSEYDRELGASKR